MYRCSRSVGVCWSSVLVIVCCRSLDVHECSLFIVWLHAALPAFCHFLQLFRYCETVFLCSVLALDVFNRVAVITAMIDRIAFCRAPYELLFY